MSSRLVLAKQNLLGIIRAQWPEREALLESVRGVFHDPAHAATQPLRELSIHAGALEEYGPWAWVFLRKNTPGVTASGKTVVLDIGEGFVAKFHSRSSLHCFGEAKLDDHYIIHVRNTASYAGHIPKTMRSLRELGFHVPFHEVVGIRPFMNADDILLQPYSAMSMSNCTFVIATDLRKRGRFVVTDADDSALSGLKNKDELKAQLDAHVRLLMGLCREWNFYDEKKGMPEPRYSIIVNNHVTDEGEEKAFRRMFLLQIDHEKQMGALALGDLDHVIIIRYAELP